jgi:hypothetical protein
MSLMQKLQALTARIEDPKVKFDIMGTINFLADLYSSGKISDEDLRNDLLDICRTVVEITNVDLTKEEIEARAKLIADDLFLEIKVRNLRKKVIRGKLDMIFR